MLKTQNYTTAEPLAKRFVRCVDHEIDFPLRKRNGEVVKKTEAFHPSSKQIILGEINSSERIA